MSLSVEQKKDRHFALKHARKCALKGNVTLANTLQERADAILFVTASEKKEIDDALLTFWSK